MFPIRNLTIFSNGFTSFDRFCLVSKEGPKDVDLYFRTADLQEVLKSLSCSVVKGQGKICSVSYQNTKLSTRDDELVINQNNGFITLLQDLCGARIEVLDVANNEKICGLLVGVEELAKEFKITLYTEGNTLKTFQLLSLSHVRFIDEKVQESIKHSLEKCIASKNKDLLKVTVFTQGDEAYSVKASYSLQQKEWLTSYCLMLDPKDQEKATFIANAVIENTQDEDWVSVTLTLVSGSPPISKSSGDSQNSTGSMSLTIKHLNGASFTVRANPYDTIDVVKEKIQKVQSDLIPSHTELIFAGKRLEEGRTLSDYGIRNEGTIHIKTRSRVSENDVTSGKAASFRLANPATQSFFKIPTLVSVKRGQSALIPLISQSLDVKQLLLYNSQIRKGNPLSALMFQNTTGYTLESGTIVLKQNDDLTVGEAMLDRMVPKDETVFPYALELGVEVSMNSQLDRDKPHRLCIKKGELALYCFKTQTTSYLFDNKTERVFPLVFVEHSFLDGWDLVEPSTPIDITDSLYRFEFAIPAVKKGSKGTPFVVKEKSVDVETFTLSTLTVARVQKLSQQCILSKELEKTLLNLIDLDKTVSSYSGQIYELESDVRTCKDSQERIRKNIQVLAESKQQQAKYVNELGAEEDKLKELYAKIKNLQVTKQNMSKHHKEECDKIVIECDISYPKV